MFSREPSTVLRLLRRLPGLGEAPAEPLQRGRDQRGELGRERGEQVGELGGGPVADHVRLAEADLASAPSRWKNAAGRTIRITGESGPPRADALAAGEHDPHRQRAHGAAEQGLRDAGPHGRVRRRGESGPHALVRARWTATTPGDRWRGLGGRADGVRWSLDALLRWWRRPGDRRGAGAATARCRAGGSGPTCGSVTSGRRASSRTSAPGVAGRRVPTTVATSGRRRPSLAQRHRDGQPLAGLRQPHPVARRRRSRNGET